MKEPTVFTMLALIVIDIADMKPDIGELGLLTSQKGLTHQTVGSHGGLGTFQNLLKIYNQKWYKKYLVKEWLAR